jgi:hypothetical protein
MLFCKEQTFVFSPSRLTDEELLAACGGLTGHKAARHGHGLTGKLLRVKNADEKLCVVA